MWAMVCQWFDPQPRWGLLPLFIIFIIFIMGSNMRKLVGNGLAGKGRPRPGAACGSLLMVLREARIIIAQFVPTNMLVKS